MAEVREGDGEGDDRRSRRPAPDEGGVREEVSEMLVVHNTR